MVNSRADEPAKTNSEKNGVSEIHKICKTFDYTFTSSAGYITITLFQRLFCVCVCKIYEH